ncbi:MAG TPA: FtsX-like permease family protein [Pyrinomonadaceae bacterium]
MDESARDSLSAKAVLKLVVRKEMVLAIVGTAIGLLASLALTRLMRSLLFQVTPTDWLTFVVASLVLLTVALLASYIPVRRTTKLDPLIALRVGSIHRLHRLEIHL